MSLLGDMGKFGLGHLNNLENDKAAIENNTDNNPGNNSGNNGAVQNSSVQKKVETEEDYIFEKVYDCPVCDAKFKQLIVKSAKARPLSTDRDLKPNYKIIDPLKYDVIHCCKCGYTSLLRYYGPLAKPHKEMLKKTIAANFKASDATLNSVITYTEAFPRYQLALANAMCRQAKSSEIALIYLKMAWLLREMQKHIDELPKEDNYSMDNLKKMEEESLKNAKEGFVNARLNENAPIAGMNEVTIDYLLAVLSMRFKEYENASKLISEILYSTSANSTQKDKARELKEELRATLLGKM